MDEYYLGIDLGTTYSAAAVTRNGQAEIVTLGDRSAVVPSVLFIRDDDRVLVGDAAVRRGVSDPVRVVREFKRRVGDPTPILVGVAPYSADTLFANLLAQVTDWVTEREGGAASGLVITHPANWGPYKTDVLRQAVRLADLGEAHTLTEPEAAAFAYASTKRVEPGQTVAVYDLGGGTFDAAVLRESAEGFEIIGNVEGIERLGGIDFDEAIFQHVRRSLGGSFEELDPTDPPTVAAVARLRGECVEAKEALSHDTDTVIPVFLPTVHTEVRLTRAEFEAMIRPSITRTIEALGRALRSADLEPEDLHAVLLVGGSSRIPLVSQMVSSALARPVAVDTHPKHAVALGAALAAASQAGTAVPTDEGSVTDEESATAEAVAAAGTAGATATATTAAATEVEPSAETDPEGDPAGAFDAIAPTAERTAATSSAADAVPETGTTQPADQTGDQAATDRARADTEPVPPPGASPPDGGEASSDEVTVAAGGPPPPPPVAPSRAADGRRSLLLVGLGILAVVAVVIVAVLALSGGGDEPVAASSTTVTTLAAGGSATATTAPTTTTAAPTATTVAPAAAAAGAAGERLEVVIDEITIEDGAYAVAYTTNYTPQISEDPASNHIHFFFNTVPMEEAGAPGAGPWILYDTPSPFTGYRPDDRPDGATQLCATAATFDHAVVDTSVFDCFDLPDVRYVTIDKITVEEGSYAVAYTTNYTPEIGGGPESNHIHFFFDTVPVTEAGVPGGGPWILYDVPSPFTGYAVSDRPDGASQMCATAATNDHAVIDTGVFQCARLPIVFSGDGNETIEFEKLDPGQPFLVDTTYEGGGVFSVWGFDSEGNQTELAASHVGSTVATGIVDFNASWDTVGFTVESEGSWTIVIRPFDQIDRAVNTASGDSDAVYLMEPDVGSPRTARVVFEGQGFIAMTATSPTENALLANSPDPITDVVEFPDGPVVLEVSADGPWSIEVRGP